MIPVCEPCLDGNEGKYIQDAINTGWISSSGKYIKEFEKRFAKYCGVKHGISTCNGTAALHLALTSLEIGKGDEVIIPDFTMVACGESVCYTGAMPVFVDAEKETWNINPENIKEKITERTKAIMPVHIYGHPCDMDPILELAEKYNLFVIEDAAEAHGTEYKGRKAGSIGDVGCFSFYANKIITTGEGGMVVTSNDKLADKCRYYRNHCFPLDGPRNYLHKDIGFNYRMTNIQGAIGLAQIEKIDEYVKARRTNNKLYQNYLGGLEGISFQPEKQNCKNVYWMNGIIIDSKKFGMSRDDLMEKLKEAKIDTRLFFNGMHKQLSLKRYGANYEGKYPISDWLASNGMYLPSGSGLREKDISYICGEIWKLKK